MRECMEGSQWGAWHSEASAFFSSPQQGNFRTERIFLKPGLSILLVLQIHPFIQLPFFQLVRVANEADRLPGVVEKSHPASLQ